MSSPNFPHTLTVTELNNHLKSLIENNLLLQNFWIRGEISNLKLATSGHIYFTLKDKYSRIKSVMFRSAAQKLLFSLANGMEVLLRAYLSIYNKEGIYQLYVQEIHHLGLGNLKIAYEQLKDKLKREGLFELDQKQTIPILSNKIGIVTSLTGSVLHDIISIISQNFPNLNIIICPAAVQGSEAPYEIAQAIKKLNIYNDVEIIILARGGGSIEELWAFNTEEVARAIYASKIPIISAIGHETDFTIADLVADLRAPTPSAAAELVSSQKRRFQDELRQKKFYLVKNIYNYLENCHLGLKKVLESNAFKYPFSNLREHKQSLEYTKKQIQVLVKNILKGKRNEVAHYAEKLNTLSPLAVLQRGYAICKDSNGNLITDANQVQEGENIEIQLKYGELFCLVQHQIKE
ncbi:exodeoxyribonuclease VII large subunit [Bacillota bacterium LX-D]|nr:exodeoxyribonuclease VII large subunit [Bacillota bacterium LX-D]